MIKTIDDLRKCYAVRADKEVFELFMDKCEEFGVTWAGGDAPKGNALGEAVVFDGAFTDRLGQGDVRYMERQGYKRLTLSDFKPIRTEYVQVAESIFDLRDEFERGELYCKNLAGNEDYQQLNTEVALFGCAAAGNVYLKVEKEIDERQEFIERAKGLIDASKEADYSLGNMYDAGCRFQD